MKYPACTLIVSKLKFRYIGIILVILPGYYKVLWDDCCTINVDARLLKYHVTKGTWELIE